MIEKKRYPSYYRRIGLRLSKQEYVRLLKDKLKMSREEGRIVTSDEIVRTALALYYAHKKKPKVPKISSKDIKNTTIYLEPKEKIHLMTERVRRVAEKGREVPQSQILREALAIYHAKPLKKRHKK